MNVKLFVVKNVERSTTKKECPFNKMGCMFVHEESQSSYSENEEIIEDNWDKLR